MTLYKMEGREGDERGETLTIVMKEERAEGVGRGYNIVGSVNCNMEGK